MGGNTSTKKAPAKASNNAYKYAKRLGISNMRVAMGSEQAERIWDTSGPKGLSFIESKENMSQLLKATAGSLVSVLQRENAKIMEDTKSKIGSQFKDLLQKLERTIARELEDNTQNFLNSLGLKDKLPRQVFVECVSRDVNIQKDGSICWKYISEQLKGQKKTVNPAGAGANTGQTEHSEAKQGVEQQKNLETNKNEDKTNRLAVRKGKHKALFSVRQLKILKKGIYAGGKTLEKTKEAKKELEKKDIKDMAISSEKLVMAKPSAKEHAGSPTKEADHKTPTPAGEYDVTVGDSKGKGLSGDRWKSKKMKAMMKFAHLRTDNGKKKKKKKKKKSEKEKVSVEETSNAEGD